MAKKIVQSANPEAMRQELQAGLEGVKNKERMINTKEILDANKLKEVRAELIKSMFEMLQKLGVDGSSLESINAFLDKLRNQDPDLAGLFEYAFNGLVGEETQNKEMTGQQDTGLMGKFNNLAPDMMMPRQ